MSFLWITIPATLALASVLLALVIRSVQRGDFDDPEGPAARMLFDDDRCPELEAGEDVATPQGWDRCVARPDLERSASASQRR